MALPLLFNSGSLAKPRSAVCSAFRSAARPTKKITKATKGSRTPNKRSAAVSPSEGAGAQYLGLAGLSAVAGTALTVAPQTVWELLGSTDIVTVTLNSSQVYGIYWLLVAAAAYRLSQAAENGNLSSLTYQRLNAFLGLFSVTSAIPLLRGALGGELSPAPAAAAAAVLAAAAVSTYFPAYLRSGGSTDVAAAAAGFGDALKATIKAGRGWTGAFYSLSFWETFILGVALVGGPILPTVAGDISGTTLILKDMVGVGTLLYGALVWMLLDADDRGRSGASTFRTLNAACGVVSVLVGVVCVAGQAKGIDTNMANQVVVLVSCLLTAGVYGFQAIRSYDE